MITDFNNLVGLIAIRNGTIYKIHNSYIDQMFYQLRISFVTLDGKQVRSEMFNLPHGREEEFMKELTVSGNKPIFKLVL